MHIHTPPLVGILLLACIPMRMGGQPVPAPPPSVKQLTLEELSQIEVSSVSKGPVVAFRTPAAITVLTQSEIRRSGATNIPDLLRLVPGVIVSQIDSDKWSIGIRGFQDRLAKSVRVMIDGRSVYTPLFAGVYWEVQDTLIEDIDRIEVIRGPGGTIWGANSVNGVINIITKRAQDTRGMLVSAGGGNVEQGFLNWRYGAGTDQLSFRIYGKGFTRGPQQHPSGRNYDDWRMGQVGFRVDWNKTERDTITIQGDMYTTKAGQQIQLSSYNPPANPAVEGNGYFSGQNLMATWRRLLKSGGDIQLRTFYDRTDRHDLNYGEIRNTVDVDFIQHKPVGWRNELSWGVGVQTSPSSFMQVIPTVDFRPHRHTYSIASAFLQNEMALVPNRLALTVGSKFEYNSFSAFEFQPAARLSWTPNDRYTVWGAVTRAVRTPSRLEEHLSFSFLANATPLYLRLFGDGQFTPEQMIGYEFGVRTYIRKSGFISVSSFHNRYSDLLSVEPGGIFVETTPAPAHLVLPIALRNGIRANGSGIEVSTLFDLRSWWRLQANYSYLGLDARRAAGSLDSSTAVQLEGNNPRHLSMVQSSFNLPHNFQLDLTHRFVSGLSHQAVPAYSTGDARLGRRLGRAIDLSLIGRNLLQPSHVEYVDNPEGGVGIRRSLYLRLTWTPNLR
jgi:iron complex outermembrane receptor protein